jgi:hypothetical protein
VGRWQWSNRRVVEDCKPLAIATVVRSGAFCEWRNSDGCRPDFKQTVYWKSGFEVQVTSLGAMSSERRGLKLSYTLGDSVIEETVQALSIPSPLRGGKRRYYFLCPGWDDCPCGRRVGKLYLPRGENYFRCRVCHGLTYRSVKEHDSRVDRMVRQLTPLMNGITVQDAADMLIRCAGGNRVVFRAVLRIAKREGKL